MKQLVFSKDRADKYDTSIIYKANQPYDFEDERAEEILKNNPDVKVIAEIKETNEIEAVEIETAIVETNNIETAVPKRKRRTKKSIANIEEE